MSVRLPFYALGYVAIVICVVVVIDVLGGGASLQLAMFALVSALWGAGGGNQSAAVGPTSLVVALVILIVTGGAQEMGTDEQLVLAALAGAVGATCAYLGVGAKALIVARTRQSRRS